ncbi:zinc-binding dehydrogenase [Corynebacterium sp. sy039]|uniref:quinone oxidoreductase family protein n=1 Tax=Corynebacterium sp. sy039 TaxID=2599641 RepID=UPI0011B83DF8|nr:zinc-binding dehydrogenase [Corynebacterium sp. sy039]QDZ42715.1 zinc-binding dehydrogenase [Corynebacterium sp. sy039]
MKKYMINNRAGVSELVLEEAQPSALGERDVEIQVTHSGLGLIDALQFSGVMGDMQGHTPGLEVEGFIRTVGAAVTNLQEGDRVAAMCFGAGLATVLVTHSDFVVKIDERMPAGMGAISLVNTVTAKESLSIARTIGRFERVLVHAGVGGLGTQFGQIASMLDAKHIDAVVGNDEKAILAKDMGYHDVYYRHALSDIPEDFYDVVIDSVGAQATTSSFEKLRSGGRVIKVGNSSGKEAQQFDSLKFWFENKTVIGFNVGLWIMEDTERAHAAMEWAVEQVAEGAIRIPYEVRPVAQLEDSLADLLNGKVMGKLVVEW